MPTFTISIQYLDILDRAIGQENKQHPSWKERRKIISTQMISAQKLYIYKILGNTQNKLLELLNVFTFLLVVINEHSSMNFILV